MINLYLGVHLSLFEKKLKCNSIRQQQEIYRSNCSPAGCPLNALINHADQMQRAYQNPLHLETQLLKTYQEAKQYRNKLNIQQEEISVGFLMPNFSLAYAECFKLKKKTFNLKCSVCLQKLSGLRNVLKIDDKCRKLSDKLEYHFTFVSTKK